MKRYQCIQAASLSLLLFSTAFAQTPPPAPAPAPAPAAAPAPWSAGGIDFSGLVDGYYSLNFNHPVSGYNTYRNFDVKANQLSLNMAKLVAEHAADPVGFRIDLGFGRTFDLVHSLETAGGARSVMQNIEQAYVTFKPPKGNGFQFDFGKFVTSAGAEVIETHPNFNYSRSLLFAWAIPYYHFGARISKPVGKYWTPGFQLVNGWNNVEDNNSGKTIGLTSAIASPKVSHFANYYVGPEKAGTNEGKRQLFDTTLLLTPNSNFSAYINYDYVTEKNLGSGSSSWQGIALAAKMSPNDWFALTPRIEYFNDRDGASTLTAQKLKEFTLTAEIKHAKGFLTRMEYRRDWSDVATFERGNGGSSKNQTTLLIGFVVFFGPK